MESIYKDGSSRQKVEDCNHLILQGQCGYGVRYRDRTVSCFAAVQLQGSNSIIGKVKEFFMKKLNVILSLAGIITLGSAAGGLVARAQETRTQAAANLPKPDPKAMDSSFTTAAPFAQALVDESLAKHPEVLLLAIHAGAPKYDIIASNFGRIGKLGDEDDLRCIRTGKDNLEVNTQSNHFEDQTPMRDKSGKIIGAIGIVFNYQPGTDKLALEKIAREVSKEMQARIPNAHRLFGPR